jgi:hypothetical protein
MLGQGWVSTSTPLPCSTSPPASSNSVADTPGSARVTEPGMVLVRPGSGEIMIAPVSVCHQVSTIGQRSAPMTVWYHSQALGLIGSPTEPSSRKQDRSCLAGYWAPHFMQARIAVGAV